MEFFGLTYTGQQNPIKDLLLEHYAEPTTKKETEALKERIEKVYNCDKVYWIQRATDSELDCYLGQVDGFAYRSEERLKKMWLKGALKPVGPLQMYRMPASTSMEYGWWMCDKALDGVSWTKTDSHHPQPTAPWTRVLDIAKKNNKFATLF